MLIESRAPYTEQYSNPKSVNSYIINVPKDCTIGKFIYTYTIIHRLLWE